MLENLVRKEVRLQQPALVVAFGVVALWLMLLAALATRLLTDPAFLILPSVLLSLGIPMLAGIVAVAEERGLGVHEWHLTLPVSARLLWTVKVLVALGVNAVLGLLLPGLLGQISSWLANNPQLVAEIPGRDVPLFLIFNLVIFCAALYASTASANSMRALVGTLVLLFAGAMVLNFADYIASGIPKLTTSMTHHADGAVTYHYTAGLSDMVHRHRWLLGWSCLAVWLYFLGLAGFRRSLESFWHPVQRMVVCFAVMLAYVFVLHVW